MGRWIWGTLIYGAIVDVDELDIPEHEIHEIWDTGKFQGMDACSWSLNADNDDSSTSVVGQIISDDYDYKTDLLELLDGFEPNAEVDKKLQDMGLEGKVIIAPSVG